MAKKITIISQDYDGCFAIMTAEGLEGELNGVNKGSWDASQQEGNDNIKMIMASRKRYADFLTKITKDSAEVKVYVGSDRQSFSLDQLNKNIHQNGSVFTALERLCDERNTLTQPWVLEPLLLSDPYILGGKQYKRNRGFSYQNIKNPTTKFHEVMEPLLQFKHPDGSLKNSKRPLLLSQMWDAYRQNAEASEIVFNFIDDRLDLIQDVLNNLTPSDIPPKMTLVVSRYDYIGDILGEPHSFCDCGAIKTSLKQKVVRFVVDEALNAKEEKEEQKVNSQRSSGSVKRSLPAMIWNRITHTNTKKSNTGEKGYSFS